jgi:hypothetical protein
MVIRDAESERPPACDPATAGTSKGRTAIGSGHRLLAPRLAMAESRSSTTRAISRRLCEPVCGVITCSGRQDACQRLSPIGNRGSARGPHGVDGMITHPVRCCSVPPTLCREFSTPPVHGAQQMDVHPVRRVRHVVSAPHTPRSVPRLPWSSSLFVLWKCQALTDPFGTRCRPEPAEGKAHSLPRCLTASLSRSLPHRRAASPPRCVVASSVRPSVRSSVCLSIRRSVRPSVRLSRWGGDSH